MREYLKFYIDGARVDPVTPKTFDVINPATEAVAGHISLGSAADVDRAVKAARRAFETYSQTSVDQRVALLSASSPNTRSATPTWPLPSPTRWVPRSHWRRRRRPRWAWRICRRRCRC